MSEDRAITVRRVLPAPPAVVYDEWLDPVGMVEWMCPRPARAGHWFPIVDVTCLIASIYP